MVGTRCVSAIWMMPWSIAPEESAINAGVASGFIVGAEYPHFTTLILNAAGSKPGLRKASVS